MEGDDPVPFGLPGDVEIPPRHLEGAFDRFRARIGEEHGVGKAVLHEPLGERLLVRHAVEVGGVPEASGLLFHGLDECGMRMTQGVDGDAGAEVQVTLPAFLNEPGALAFDEGERRPRIGWKDGRNHGI